MDNKTPEEIIDLLKGPKLIVRVGLWLYPILKLGQERDDAAQLGIDAIDMQSHLLDDLPRGTAYSGISHDKILDLLQRVSGRTDLSSCVLISNLDLLLSYLPFLERQSIWDILFNGFPHKRRAIFIPIPETAHQLLPVESKLLLWGDAGRLA